MIGRLLCRIGVHNDWIISVGGTPPALVFTIRCNRCERIR